MELRDFVRLLRRGWQLILAFLVIGTGAGIGITLATTKVYQADVQLFVATSAGSSISDLNNGNSYVQDRVQSYTSIANSPAVTQQVVKTLALPYSADTLADHVTSDAPKGKVLVNLHVTDDDPTQAARIANAVAVAFTSVVEQTERTDANNSSVVKLTVIHPATVPSVPITPNKVLNIGLGLVVGLLIGVGFVVLRDVLDNTVKGPEDFEEWDVPVLGLVPYDKRAAQAPIAFRDDPHGSRSEAYRQLRTNLQFVRVDDAPRVIAVTSAVPGEGKTTTSINLAAALADGGFRVCLIEADLRRPTIGKVLGLVTDVGFTTALIGKADPVDVLQTVGRNLAVMTSGPIPPNPSELLITDQARSIIRQVAELADFTIIDTAPLLPVADGAEVAAMADATVVVHHAGKSTREQVRRALETLTKVGERPVGAVLNRLSNRRSGGDYYYYGYTYNYRPDRSRRADKNTGKNTDGAASGQHTGDLTGELTSDVVLDRDAAPAGEPTSSLEILGGGEQSATADRTT